MIPLIFSSFAQELLVSMFRFFPPFLPFREISFICLVFELCILLLTVRDWQFLIKDKWFVKGSLEKGTKNSLYKHLTTVCSQEIADLQSRLNSIPPRQKKT